MTRMDHERANRRERARRPSANRDRRPPATRATRSGRCPACKGRIEIDDPIALTLDERTGLSSWQHLNCDSPRGLRHGQAMHGRRPSPPRRKTSRPKRSPHPKIKQAVKAGACILGCSRGIKPDDWVIVAGHERRHLRCQHPTTR